jgi:hypothetical protein
VTTVAVRVPVAKVAPAEIVNVTLAPDTGLPDASLTTASSRVPKGCPTTAVCPSPAPRRATVPVRSAFAEE